MYGLGGSFGGMPYQSPAGAAADGIVAGWNMVRQSNQQDRENARQDRLDQMNAAHMAFMERNETDKARREDFKQAWDVHNQQRQDIGSQMNDVLRANGGDENKAQADPRFADLQKQIQDWNGVHSSLMKSVYSGVHAQGLDDARATTERMNAGNFDPTHPDNAEDLAHWASVMFRQDPAKLLSPKYLDPNRATNAQFNQPTEGAGIQDADARNAAAVKGASDQVADYGVAAAKDNPDALSKSMWSVGAQDLHQGLTQGDPKQTAAGFQSLYGPQIEAGRLGYLDRLGGQITSAVINPDKPFVPTPDGKKAMPVMSTTGQLPDGSTTQQPYAPPTQGGFHHDDNQDLHALDVGKTFDYLGQQGAAHSIIQHPGVQSNLADYMQNPSPKVTDWAAAYSAIGAGDNTVTKLENDGGRLLAVSYTKDGRVVRTSEVPGSLPTSEYAARELALQNAVKNQETNPSTGKPWTQEDADNARINGIVKATNGGKEDVAGQKFTIALNYLKDELHANHIDQATYNQKLEQLIGIAPKAGNDLPAAKNRGALADEQTHLDQGEFKDPVNGWTKAKTPEQLQSLRVARLAFNKRAQAEGVTQPGIGGDRVHDVPGSTDPQDASAKPPAAPPNQADRQDQTTYMTPKGPMVWHTGKGWAAPSGSVPK